MGSWGYGIFENDDVLDWKAELLETKGLDFIELTLDNVIKADYIEADLSSNGLGAIEIVAALQGKPGVEIRNKNIYVEGLDGWIKLYAGQGESLIEAAKIAVKRIKTDSELKELWEDSDEFAEWLKVVRELESRLLTI